MDSFTYCAWKFDEEYCIWHSGINDNFELCSYSMEIGYNVIGYFTEFIDAYCYYKKEFLINEEIS